MQVFRKKNAVIVGLCFALLGTTALLIAGMVRYHIPDPLWIALRNAEQVDVPRVELSDFYLGKLPRPKLAFPDSVTGSQGVRSWQRVAKRKLLDLLKPTMSRDVPQVRSVQRDEVDGVVCELLIMTSFDDVEVPAFLLWHQESTPRAALLVVAGHSSGIRATTGYLTDYQHANALVLAKAGYIVLTIEIRGMGYLNRMGTAPNKMLLETHSSHCLLRGTTALGLTVSDLMLGLNYLETREDVRANKIGVVGFSSGGLAAIYFAALDERVGSVVASGCVMSHDSSLRFSRHDVYGVVPEQLNWLEMSDCLGLLSPRPLLVHWGALDSNQEGRSAAFNPSSLPTFEAAKRIYEADGHRAMIEKFITPHLGHEFDNDAALEFLARRLPPTGDSN